MKFSSGSQITDADHAPETLDVKGGAARAGKGGSAKRHISSFSKTLVPIASLAATAGLSHAAPTIDMSGVTSVMQMVETACLLIGAITVLIGFGPTWITSLTGQGV